MITDTDSFLTEVHCSLRAFSRWWWWSRRQLSCHEGRYVGALQYVRWWREASLRSTPLTCPTRSTRSSRTAPLSGCRSWRPAWRSTPAARRSPTSCTCGHSTRELCETSSSNTAGTRSGISTAATKVRIEHNRLFLCRLTAYYPALPLGGGVTHCTLFVYHRHVATGG